MNLGSFTVVLAVLAVLLGPVAMCLAQSTRPAGEEILLKKEIAPGQEIVITREQIDSKRLGVLGADLAGRQVTTSVVRVELVLAHGVRTLLGSSIHSEYDDFRKGFAVLDVFTAEMEVVIVCTMGSEVGLWRISLDQFRSGRDGWVLTPPDIRLAVGRVLDPSNVTVAMTKMPDRRWKLVLGHPGGLNLHTVTFEQVENAWAFKQVDPPGFGKPNR